MKFDDHDYHGVANNKLLNVPSLQSARCRSDIIFAYKLFNNPIDCNELLSLFQFYGPLRMLRHNN